MKTLPVLSRYVPLTTGPKVLLPRPSFFAFSLLLFPFFSFLFPFFLQGQTTYFVKSDATGANSGLSWSNAFVNLQDAIQVATAADQIWVAQGTYKPSALNGGTTERYKTFFITKGMSVYGGFAGTEDSLHQRDPMLHPTILSGDIDNNDNNSDGNGIAEKVSDVQGANAYHVVTLKNVNASVLLDGLTVTAGAAELKEGGGLWVTNGGVQYATVLAVKNCWFSGNFASSGGATYASVLFSGSCALEYQDCFFRGNAATNKAGAIGNYCSSGNLTVHINQCGFEDNTAANGGAVYNDLRQGETSIGFTGCQFEENTATGSGGAINTSCGFGNSTDLTVAGCIFLNNAGGAFYLDIDNYEAFAGTVTGCVFEGNSGGALYYKNGEATNPSFFITDSRFSNTSGSAIYNKGEFGGNASPVILRCVFEENEAGFYGGAIYNDGIGSVASPVIANCLFYGNSAGEGGAIRNFALNGTSSPVIRNCTFYGNVAWDLEPFANVGSAIFSDGTLGICTTTVTNCIFWGNSQSNGVQTSGLGARSASYSMSYSLVKSGFTNAPGMIHNQDPAFADSVAGNFHLTPTSPGVDQGNNLALTMADSLDLDGAPRILNASGTAQAIVDMGCFEFAGLVATGIVPLNAPYLSLAPNPAGEVTVVEWTAPAAETAVLQIFDPSGKLLQQHYISVWPGINRFALPVANLPTGICRVVMTVGKKNGSQWLIKR